VVANFSGAFFGASVWLKGSSLGCFLCFQDVPVQVFAIFGWFAVRGCRFSFATGNTNPNPLSTVGQYLVNQQ
jgi:hypothetical protein